MQGVPKDRSEEKQNVLLSGREIYTKIGGEKERQRDRQTEIDRLAEKETDRQKQTDR